MADVPRPSGAGRAALAASLIAIGIAGLVRRGFVALWSGVPADFPARHALAYLCVAVALGAGAGLLWRRTAPAAARALLAYFGLWMLVFRVPALIHAPTSSGIWWAAGSTAVMIAAAWLLSGAPGAPVAKRLYGLGLIPFGVAHFTFLERTVSMVPGWLPGHLAWAYATGGALIAGGGAIVLGVRARLAAVLLAVELSLFTLLVWGPVLAAGADAEQWNEILVSAALTAAAWVVAEACRGAGWIGAGIPAHPTA